MKNIYKALTFLSGADGILYRPGEIIPEEAITDEAWMRLMEKGAIATEMNSSYEAEEESQQKIREEGINKNAERMSQQADEAPAEDEASAEDEAPVEDEQADEDVMPVLSIDAADAIVDDAKPAAKRGRTRK